mmetsp:Transcript_8983/g.31797  ORF Transcript_8983/g.31797 Transcript_8983/m.31797 type:complete len:200 (-) Transcript_8983:139-738(-)
MHEGVHGAILERLTHFGLADLRLAAHPDALKGMGLVLGASMTESQRVEHLPKDCLLISALRQVKLGQERGEPSLYALWLTRTCDEGEAGAASVAKGDVLTVWPAVEFLGLLLKDVVEVMCTDQVAQVHTLRERVPAKNIVHVGEHEIKVRRLQYPQQRLYLAPASALRRHSEGRHETVSSNLLVDAHIGSDHNPIQSEL